MTAPRELTGQEWSVTDHDGDSVVVYTPDVHHCAVGVQRRGARGGRAALLNAEALDRLLDELLDRRARMPGPPRANRAGALVVWPDAGQELVVNTPGDGSVVVERAVFYCEGASCPGLPYRASATAHPPSCVGAGPGEPAALEPREADHEEAPCSSS